MKRSGDTRCVESLGHWEPGDAWAACWDSEFNEVWIHLGKRSIMSVSDGTQICVKNPLRYPLDQILMFYAMANREGVLLHAAGAVIGEGGYLFAGPSGAGKSTISQIIAESSPDIKLLSDDRILVRRIGGRFHMFGTPWAGTAGIAKNCGAPLKGILFLEKAGENRVEPLDGLAALPGMLKVASIPWFDRDAFPPILQTTEAILNETPKGRLRFRPDSGAVEHIMRFAERASG